MMKTKSTKRALLMSALALALCVSMLIGSTFAWFTDSVTSANNIIKSGNLDIELYYQVEGKTDWTPVDNTTNVFMEDALWEPGHTEVVKLKVVNEGTLALKYQLGVNIASETGSVNVDGKEFLLSDYIKYGIVNGAEDYTRDTAVAAVDATANPLKTAYSSGSVTLLPKTDVNPDNEDIITMVVYMPTTVGNEANYAKGEAAPTINLGINLVATQVEAESDSFGPDYDEGLDPEASYVSTPAQLQAALKEGGKVVLQDDIALDSDEEFTFTDSLNGALMYLYHVDATIDLNGHDIIAEADAVMDGKTEATALFLVRYSTLNIVGEGNIITKNKAIPVYGWAHSEINIYGGTFKGNAYERNESDVYVNNASVTINVYGGDFMNSGYAFNTHDKSANAPVIILHEGVTYKDFLKNGTTDVIADDMNKGRIVLADGMYLKTYEENGETVHEVAKKQEDAEYTSDYNAIASGWGESNEYVLDGDLTADNYIYFGDNTANAIDLNGKDVDATGGYLFVTDGENCSLTIDGDGTVNTKTGFVGFANTGGSLNIKGGTYQLGETNNAAHLYSQNSATIVIDGGKFISTDANTPIVYCINGFVEINGGFFQNTANPSAALLDMGNNLSYVNNQKITLRGGTFVNWNPMNSAFAMDWPQCPALIVLADGYTVVSETQANGDVWYTVVAE